MQLIGYLLLACMALAVIKAAVLALAVVLGIVLFTAAITHPREIAGFILLGAFVSLIENHGFAFLCVVGLAVVAGALRR